ncbi:prorelaxin-like [Pteronotus mesoamericanus]|uniref:prorelaxin-like n=1 Tax=Pteronotus mesoamericanus TaxID=1884717 RepID=UPI0023EB2277|nr:prorelaxin-like [Pteronotus parnellii mesoamericanus]
MLRLFLFHLLGSSLLLSQLPREIQGLKEEIFIKCNRELVRFFIKVCGSHVWAEGMRKPHNTRSEPSAEIIPFSTTENAEYLNTIMEFTLSSPRKLKTTLAKKHQAASENTNRNFKELQENTIGAGDKSLSELKNIRLVKHLLKKRDLSSLISTKCCSVGCTKREVAQFC